jgi:hypothetical protein
MKTETELITCKCGHLTTNSVTMVKCELCGDEIWVPYIITDKGE